MGKKEHLEIIKKFLSKVSEDFVIKKIVFFGSRANGGYKTNSDIDLIIVSDDFKEMNFIERASKMYDYWSADLPVDFICYTSKEFEKLKKMISIVKFALENGLVLEGKG